MRVTTSLVALVFLFCVLTTNHIMAVMPQQGQVDRPTFTLTEVDNGKTIETRAGDTLSLTLAENVTTGYSWKIVGGDEKIVALVSSNYAQAGGNMRERAEKSHEVIERHIVGRGGIRSFMFRCVAAGSTKLNLLYKRPIEYDHAREFSVTLNVKP